MLTKASSTNLCDSVVVADASGSPGGRLEGFDEWYRHEHPRVLGAMYVLSRDRDIAGDATDEAFARALARWPRVSTMRSPGAWVHKVALNVVRRTGRRKGMEATFLSRQRTHDVLAVLDWLKAQGHSEVHLIGKGWGAIPAAFAGLLAPGVVQVTLKNALTSYSAIAESVSYQWPLALLVPGLLEQFDLPRQQLRNSLRPRSRIEDRENFIFIGNRQI